MSFLNLSRYSGALSRASWPSGVRVIKPAYVNTVSPPSESGRYARRACRFIRKYPDRATPFDGVGRLRATRRGHAPGRVGAVPGRVVPVLVGGARAPDGARRGLH